jgi:AcrR family transcriptional regulator
MSPSPDPRRALTKGQRTRQRLLRAAVTRFGEQGYRRTSVSQLSRDAGLTPAAAYAYFADKETIWAAAIEADLDDIEHDIRQKALGSDRPLFELMTGVFTQLDRHPLTRRVMSDGSHADLQLVLNHHLFAGTTELVADRLVTRRAAGLLPADADPATMALGLETLIFSMMLSSVRAGMADDRDRIWAAFELLRTALGGSATPDEVPAE